MERKLTPEQITKVEKIIGVEKGFIKKSGIDFSRPETNRLGDTLRRMVGLGRKVSDAMKVGLCNILIKRLEAKAEKTTNEATRRKIDRAIDKLTNARMKIRKMKITGRLIRVEGRAYTGKDMVKAQIKTALEQEKPTKTVVRFPDLKIESSGRTITYRGKVTFPGKTIAEMKRQRQMVAKAERARTKREAAPPGTNMEIPKEVLLKIAGYKPPSGRKEAPAGAFKYELRVGGARFSVASTDALSKENFKIMKETADTPKAMLDQMKLIGITSVKGPDGKNVTPEMLISQLQKGSIQLIAKSEAAKAEERKRM